MNGWELDALSMTFGVVGGAMLGSLVTHSYVLFAVAAVLLWTGGFLAGVEFDS